MDTFREKFNRLHRELSNCRSELVLIRQRANVSENLEEEKRLKALEDKLDQELKDLKPDNDT